MKLKTKIYTITIILTVIFSLILLGRTGNISLKAFAETNTGTDTEIIIDDAYSFYIQANDENTFIWYGEDGNTSTTTSLQYGSTYTTMTGMESAYRGAQRAYKEGHIFSCFVFDDENATEKIESFEQFEERGIVGEKVLVKVGFEKEYDFCISYVGTTSYITAAYGDSIQLPVPANETGHEFKNWVIASVEEASENACFVGSGTLEPGTVFNVTTMPDLSVGEEVSGIRIWLKAVQEPLKYTVTYTSQYGTLPNSCSQVTYGTIPEFICPSEVEGREFNGWYTGANGTGTQISDGNGNGLQAWGYAENKTAYAYWTAIEYTITYNLNGGSYPSGVTNPTTYTIDTETITLNNPVKDGYEFDGWIDSLGVTLDNRIIPKGSTGDKTLRARWLKICILTFNTGAGTPCAEITTAMTRVVQLPSSSRTGYSGTWDFGLPFGNQYHVVGDKTFTAEWTPNTYTITFKRNDGTTGETSKTVEYNATMPDITYPTRSGYRFEYYEDSNGNKYYIYGQEETRKYTFTENITLTAHWSEYYLEIFNLGKSGSTWTIGITNDSSTEIKIYYNSKMCNYSDAQNWTGLKDIESVTLPAHSSTTVTIRENWFATSITVSYVKGGVRRITYADELTTSGGMNVKTNKIT